MFGHKSDEWQTPQDLFNQLDNEFGHFDMDVAATPNNSKCIFFCSKDMANRKDGLKSKWMIKNWCNPPYSMQKEFVIKALEEQKMGCLTVMLLPARTDTKLFHEYIYNKPNIEIRFIKGRIKFISPDGSLLRGTKMNGSNDAAPFASMLVIIKGMEIKQNDKR
jgi:site-specific DNA-methyltransferase (adenine-specific)